MILPHSKGGGKMSKRESVTVYIAKIYKAAKALKTLLAIAKNLKDLFF